MKHVALAGTLAAGICFGFAGPLLAAPAPSVGASAHGSPAAKNTATTAVATACLKHLSTFDNQMEKSGYWLGGDSFGHGRSLVGSPEAMIGSPALMKHAAPRTAAEYENARPGYEVRILVASATVLARNGQAKSCEAVLATAHAIYARYVGAMRNGNIHPSDASDWRRRQIGAARPVAGKNIAFQSDELIDATVLNPQNETLGSVDDILMSRKTGKIAFLVISRGGVFGIGEAYVPVPWADFKVSPNLKLLVLDTTKAAMNGAPKVTDGQSSAHARSAAKDQQVDAYWKTHLVSKSANPPKG